MAKYVDNMFHALKIGFANEIGTIARAVGVDSHEVMDIFCRDRKLNISPAYLKPGFAFGGSCLPKDLRAMLYHARTFDLDLPLLSSILPGNEAQLQRAIDMVFAQGKKKLGFLGMSFKPGTDDLRESPLVRLIEAAIGRGYEIRIFDRNVSLARLVGANKAYIEHEIPHISRLLSTKLDDVTAFAEVLVVGHKNDEFAAAVSGARPGTVVIDLARVVDEAPEGVDYIGFNW
jgi:GDP-mannose 6-dehydrogenase